MGKLVGQIKENPVKHNVEWKIKNANSLSKCEGSYTSPNFFFANGIWRFDIFFYTDDMDFFLLTLYENENSSTLPMNIGLEVFSEFNTLDEKQCHKEIHCTYFSNKIGTDKINPYHTLWRCLFSEMKSEQHSILTVILKNLDSCEPANADSASGSSKLLQENKVLHDFKQLFLEKEDCDVLLKVKGEDFSAHKAILKARSCVFASTFRNEMKEKTTGIVEIEDCDPSCFSDFLCFLYCGDVGILSKENVFSLFTAADKYDVKDLRSKCLEFMKNILSVETFCGTMTVALMHSETELINFTTDFFTKNAEEIILTVKWQSFLVDNPTASNELFIKRLAADKRSTV